MAKTLSIIFIIFFHTSPVFAQTHIVQNILTNNMIELANGEVVRLIGVDNGAASTGKAYLTKWLVGKEVLLEYDTQVKDHDQISLAYVWEVVKFPMKKLALMRLKTDPTFKAWKGDKEYGWYLNFVNAKMIQNGQERHITTPPNIKYIKLFKHIYQSAKHNKHGLWGEEKKPSSHMIKSIIDLQEHAGIGAETIMTYDGTLYPSGEVYQKCFYKYGKRNPKDKRCLTYDKNGVLSNDILIEDGLKVYEKKYNEYGKLIKKRRDRSVLSPLYESF